MAGNPHRDGVSIKILVIVQPENTILKRVKMSNISYEQNGVNDYGINDEVVSPGMCPADQQRRPGRNPTTAGTRRKKWTRIENEVAMESYLRIEPEKRGYRKRLADLWRQNDMVEISEQRLMNQIRQIKKKGWFSQLEIERIKRRIMDNGECTECDGNMEVNIGTDEKMEERNHQYDNNPTLNVESDHQVEERTTGNERLEDQLLSESAKAIIEKLKSL